MSRPAQVLVLDEEERFLVNTGKRIGELMIVSNTALSEVLLIEPDVFSDAPGYFKETWSELKYREIGVTASFVRDNLSCP